MTELNLLTIALVQGLTEFLPISSSGHLVLIPYLTQWPDQGIAVDVAAHLGTLIAVCTYFWRDLHTLSVDALHSCQRRHFVGDGFLALAIVAGTIPVGLFGLAAYDFISGQLRTTEVIATTTIVFGALLWWADRRGRQTREIRTLNLRDVLLVGCAQALALVPGTSRSGITITAGLALGLTREAATRFSFLLSIPVIVLASGVAVLDLVEQSVSVDWGPMFGVVALSALSAFACIHFFLSFVNRIGMLPFVLYRFVLGAVLIVFVL